jgi:hypothetical protein
LRRKLDNNTLSKTDATTAGGAAIKQQTQKYWDLLDLGHIFGCAPQQYSPYANFTSPDSLYGLWITRVVPSYANPSQPSRPFFIINTSSLRDNIYKGSVNRYSYRCLPTQHV